MRVADGVEGHTQIIGLFSSDWPSNRQGKTWDGCSPRLSPLHHFAIEISLRRYESVLSYLTEQGLHPNTQMHPWVGWRSIYVSDPGDNAVEFVCYDSSLLAA
jgi:catechol 2,3-dioxygenase